VSGVADRLFRILGQDESGLKVRLCDGRHERAIERRLDRGTEIAKL
jgi:hypothetical protein